MTKKRITILLGLIATVLTTTCSASICPVPECECFLQESGRYQLSCKRVPNKTLYYQPNSYALLVCNRNSSLSSLNFPRLSLGAVETLTIEMCVFPDNETFADVISKIGVQDFKKLRFRLGRITPESDVFDELNGLNVTSVELMNNHITRLPADLLRGLPHLKQINFRSNEISTLAPGFFDYTPDMQYIELGMNSIERIEPGLFKSLSSLKSLYIWKNRLTELKNDYFVGLTDLKILELRRNPIASIEENAFVELRNLQTLSLAACSLKTLPPNLFKQNHLLQSLVLNGNTYLEELPDQLLANMTNLGEINLNECNLTALPAELLAGSSKLENLTLASNRLNSLPKTIFRTNTDLKLLDLSSNELEVLPDELLSEQFQLNTLKLQNNFLTSISDKVFASMHNLQYLYLNENDLSFIHFVAFNTMASLEHLNLEYNRLTFEYGLDTTVGPTSPFQENSNMKYLNLSHNYIDTMCGDWITNFPLLETMDLSYNNFTTITFTDVDLLAIYGATVILSHNRITSLDLSSAELIVRAQDPGFHGNVNVDKVYLEDNPIDCDCGVYDLLRYFDGAMDPRVRAKVEFIPGDLTCATPKEYKGRQVTSLRAETFTCSYVESEGPRVCPEECSCRDRPYYNMLEVDCSYRNLTEWPVIRNRVFSNISVVAAGNYLETMPGEGMGYERAITIDASNNKISSLQWLPPRIMTLELNNNNLEHLSYGDLSLLNRSKTLRNISLYNNPWRCDCRALNLTIYLQEHFKQTLYPSLITCASTGRPLNELGINDLCPVPVGLIVGSCVFLASIGITVGLLAYFYYRYQQEIKVWLYAHQKCLWFVTEEEVDKDKLYDAFISFSHVDEDFVVNHLMPELESGPRPYKLCVHIRDWVSGEWIPIQIARSVADSRRTLVVLSPNFLESVWGRMEFRTAHVQALSEKRARVIIILYGDIGPTDDLDPELKAYLSMNTYVKWGDPWFWDKLRYAMPHPPKFNRNAKSNKRKNEMLAQKIMQALDDRADLIKVPPTPPAVTTPPADSLVMNPLNDKLSNGLNVTFTNGTAVNV